MSKEYQVNDQYRRHELSLQPGGEIIHVIHADGKKFTYDKIKSVGNYVKQVILDPNVVEVWHETQKLIWKKEK